MAFRFAGMIRLAAVAFAALGVSGQALACSVCVVANDNARFVYYGTTALLSLLPLALIGGVVLYIVKKGR